MASAALQSIAGVSVAGSPIPTGNAPDAQPPYSFPRGSWTFVPPKAGYWKFVLWGAGGSNGGGSGISGPSGAYCEITRYLTTAQSVALVTAPAVLDTASTATFPDGKVASAGSVRGGPVIGLATGGDINLNGTPAVGAGTGATGLTGAGTGGGAGGVGDGSFNDGGSGAPAMLPFRGGQGGDTSYVNGATPGGSGTGNSSQNSGGLILVVFVRS